MTRQLMGLLLLPCLMPVAAGRAAAQTGEIRGNAGIAGGMESGGLPSSLALTGSFSFVISSVAAGPEVLYIRGDERVFGLGGVIRLHLGSAPLRPYLVGSLGGNFWKGKDFGTAGLFSGSLGMGVLLKLGLRPDVQFSLEGRVYDNLQRLGGRDDWAFATIGGGLRLGW
jgi:hypothetical protein